VARTVKDVYQIHAVTIPNGIPIAEYTAQRSSGNEVRQSLGIAENDFVFVCVANLSQAKNHALLLAAFNEVIATTTQRVMLLLVGDGPLRPTLMGAATHLGTTVRFLGVRNDVPRILAAANAFVLASDYEGNPLSVMEAMAASKPVVATAVGGIPELITTGVDGLTVPPRDAKALAAAMHKLVDNPRLTRLLGAEAAASAKARFSVTAMAQSYGSFYRAMLGGQGAEQQGKYDS